MTTAILMHELKTFVEKAVAHLQIGKDDKVPTVHLGYLPIKRVPDPQSPPVSKHSSSEEPYILIRPLEGEDEQNLGLAKVLIGFGCYDETEQGYIDLLNMIEDVKQAILRAGLIGDGMYEIAEDKKIKWHIYGDDNWPEWIGQLETYWTMPGIQREVNLDG